MGGEIHPHGLFDRPRVAEIAATRRWVLSTAELHALGWSSRAIEGAVRTGFLHRRHRGVYAVGRPELSFEGHCRAACLACGPGSAVSHGAAARLWSFRNWFGPIHLVAPRGRAGHPGLVVHRPRVLLPEDMIERGHCAVTTVARTLLDLSPGSRIDDIGRWIHEARVQRVLDRGAVLDVCRRHANHRGRPRLEAALELEVLPTRSGLEDAFLVICRRARVPQPLVNGELWSGERTEEVDFHWPDRRLIVETDGGRYHGTRWRRRRDQAKDERFRARGWTVWRVPELDVTLAPREVATELRRLLATGGRRPLP